jgi:hypothetical protein
MGNLSYLIQKENSKNFNINTIFDFLSKNFKQYNIKNDNEFNQISIIKNDDIICLIYEEQCYSLYDIDDAIKNYFDFYDNDDTEDLNFLTELKNLNLIKYYSIGMTYPQFSKYYKERDIILETLKKQFDCFLLDDGIYPEFLK